MTDSSFLARTVSDAVRILPEVRRLYPPPGAVALAGVLGSALPGRGDGIRVTRTDRLVVEADVGLAAEAAAVPSALRIVAAIRAALRATGEREGTIVVRIVSCD